MSLRLILAERDELAGQSRQRDWSARLTLGYAMGSTDSTTATGPNAGIHVEIPLFDRTNELNVLKARSAFQQRQDGVLTNFLGQMEKLLPEKAEGEELHPLLRKWIETPGKP